MTIRSVSRVLNGHLLVTAEPLFTTTVEDKNLKQIMLGQTAMHIRLGADGIAIGANGARLYLMTAN